MNAVKLGRVFAMPFVGCLDGHRDGISCLGKHPSRLSWLYSGACDGEVLFMFVVFNQLIFNVSSSFRTVETLGCIKEKSTLHCPSS